MADATSPNPEPMSTKPQPESALVPARMPTLAQVSGAARMDTMKTAFKGLMPTSVGEAQALAQALAKSQVIPKSLRNKADDVFVVILTGLELGLSPMQAVNNISVISGNLSLKANLQLAIVRQSGLLAFWDEGFDTSAQDRMDWFGWCEVERDGVMDPDTPGKRKRFRRVFSVRQAMNVKITSYEDDGSGYGNREKTSRPLAEKDNYQNWPERMYPYRARSWVLEAVFGDVLKGLPSTEGLEGGQIIDAEIIRRDDEPADDLDVLMSQIRDDDSELATALEAGFDVLRFSPARRLQKLVEYKGKPNDLATWLRDEWGRQSGKGDVGTRQRAKEGAAKLAGDDTKPAAAATKPPTGDTNPAPAATDPPAGESNPRSGESKAADPDVPKVTGRFGGTGTVTNPDPPKADPPKDPALARDIVRQENDHLKRQQLDARAHLGDGDGAFDDATGDRRGGAPTRTGDLAARFRQSFKPGGKF